MGEGKSFVVKAINNKDRQNEKTSPDIVMNAHRYELKYPSESNEKIIL